MDLKVDGERKVEKWEGRPFCCLEKLTSKFLDIGSDSSGLPHASTEFLDISTFPVVQRLAETIVFDLREMKITSARSRRCRHYKVNYIHEI